jgi:hypothetical protein
MTKISGNCRKNSLFQASERPERVFEIQTAG